MKGLKLRIRGRWAQFRKPETNNNPLTHDFITKTAVIGMIGAVLGIERPDMRLLIPILSQNLLYGVQVNGVVQKESWAFTMRNASRPNDPAEKAPRQMEFLREPDFTVALALQNDLSVDIFDRFAEAVSRSEACFTPVLGLHNCPAELEMLESGFFLPEQGAYRSTGFVLRTHRPSEDFNIFQFRLGFERIPTSQDDNWWNQPANYSDVIYPSNGAEIAVTGDFFRFTSGETWCLV